MTSPSDASVTEAMVARAARHIGGGSTFDEEDRLEMARAILEEAFAALSLPTPKGNNDERLPCDVFVPPALILRKGIKYSTLLEALSHRVGKNIAPIDAATIRGAQ